MASKPKKETISVRSVIFSGYSFTVPEKGGVSIKVAASCEATEKVLEELGIEELPETYSGGDITLELPAGTVEFKPSGTGVEKYAFTFPFQKIDGFKISVVKVKAKKGTEEAHEQKLSFGITTLFDNADRKMSQYLRALGRHKGTLKITYLEQPTQGTIGEEVQQTMEGAEVTSENAD